jgi:hypothetical protein
LRVFDCSESILRPCRYWLSLLRIWHLLITF